MWFISGKDIVGQLMWAWAPVSARVDKPSPLPVSRPANNSVLLFPHLQNVCDAAAYIFRCCDEQVNMDVQSN